MLIEAFTKNLNIPFTVTIEGLAHAPNVRIPPAAHAHNPGNRHFCAPIYAHAHNRKNILFF